MVSSRKRGRQEMEVVEAPKEPGMLERLRNMWQFANLAQWIFIFGKVVKISEDLDIEELEMECLRPGSPGLADIGLSLLKFISSHRGLTPELFDEYTRRQYVAKAPERNPFGTDEEPAKFADFDVFTKIRVLQQLTQWTFGNPQRIREKMEEHPDSEQTYWRIEPFGWDSQDRTYIVLDDNRLYRQTEPPPPPPPKAAPKKNSKKGRAAARASKRRKVADAAVSDDDIGDDTTEIHEDATEDDGLGGIKWECIAITLDDFNKFLVSIDKSRDPNEKILKKRIVDDLLPILEKQEESRKRKQVQKEKELLNMEKLAHAKRSSRIAGKLEQQRQEDEVREAERKRAAELAMARKEQEKWRKLEKERESRMMTREQRVKEREARRILHEEELANLSEDSKKLETGEGRLSERHLKAEIEKKKQALEQLAEEDDWVFDCICGAYGQVDDGTLSIACEKCNIWQHTKCVGVSDEDAGRDDFQFICKTCIRRAEEEERAKNQPKIMIKLNRPSSSSSTAPPILPPVKNSAPQPSSTPAAPHISPSKPQPTQSPSGHSAYDSPYSHNTRPPILPPLRQNGLNGFSTPSSVPNVDVRPVSQGSFASPQMNGHTPARPYFAQSNGQNAFSSPRPYSPTSLPPPIQPPNYSSLNGHTTQTVNSTIDVTQSGLPQQTLQQTPGPSLSRDTQIHATPISNGHQFGGDQIHRRSSITFPSPLAGAPVLSPYATGISANASAQQNNQAAAFTPQPTKGFNNFPTSTPGNSTHAPYSEPTPSFSQAGISPIKHSPPTRPSTANGLATSFGSSTPSIIPPMVPLSPSPQHQNLSPPVKSADPERRSFSGEYTTS